MSRPRKVVLAICLTLLAGLVVMWLGERNPCKPLPLGVRRQLTDAMQHGGVVQIPQGCWRAE